MLVVYHPANSNRVYINVALKNRRTNIYLPEELIARLNAIAQGRTLAAMVREAVIFYLAHHEPKRKE